MIRMHMYNIKIKYATNHYTRSKSRVRFDSLRFSMVTILTPCVGGVAL